MRWHPIDHEHEWRAAVIGRLDRIIELLERRGGTPTARPGPEPGGPFSTDTSTTSSAVWGADVTLLGPADPSEPERRKQEAAEALVEPAARTCPQCGKQFGSPHAVRVHQARAHGR